MIIQVEPGSLDSAGSSLQTSVSAPLFELSALASGIDGTLAAAAGDLAVAGAGSAMIAALTQALSNGGVIAGLFGRALCGGAAAYQKTDQQAFPATNSCPAPSSSPTPTSTPGPSPTPAR